ncbi:MAG: tRNA guanosine(34) transglycosylase Tgt [Elusimicrobia bacterium]|nr:tRNA guanosine(34) transglycosylase Tgt [Elusimicrobiota bacterium]
MKFEALKNSSGLARVGRVTLANGLSFKTPAFMPVATQASVKALGVDDLKAAHVRMLLSNTYHLVLRPGLAVIQRAGGLHRFMNWDGGILTDSGGFQVMSLNHLVRLSEEGASFRSHIDGQLWKFTPESVIEAQMILGSDAVTCLDVCSAYPVAADESRQALEMTLRWSERAKKRFDGFQAQGQGEDVMLFGIVQGGFDEVLRREAVQRMAGMGFEAFALGGLSVGEPKELTWAMTETICRFLQESSAPRYLMGVGDPLDFWEACRRGVDLMDCVLPTRNARNGQALTSLGKLYVKNRDFRDDNGPLDPECPCLTCRSHSRAYLAHLYHAGELLLYRLLSLHNIAFMIRLAEKIQQAIEADRLDAAFNEFRRNYANKALSL